jgi:hypothetical protein
MYIWTFKSWAFLNANSEKGYLDQNKMYPNI